VKKIVFLNNIFKVTISFRLSRISQRKSRNTLVHLFLNEVIPSTYLSGTRCAILLSFVSFFFLIRLKGIAEETCGGERRYILSWTSCAGLSGIHGGCNSLLAFPFGPSSLDFRVLAILRVYTRASIHREPGNESVGSGWSMVAAWISLSSSWERGVPFIWSLHDIAQVSSSRTYHGTTICERSFLLFASFFRRKGVEWHRVFSLLT